MAAGKKKDAPKRDYVQEVAGRLIAQLQAGTAPWQKPWAPGEITSPMNPTSGKAYRGMNAVWLMMQGREDNRWLTYRQAESLGAQVRKGEKGTLVQYWIWREDRLLTDPSGKPILGEGGKPLKETVQLERPKVMSSVVFNAEQIDGMPERVVKVFPNAIERHERAEAMLIAAGVPIHYVNGDRAFYSPGRDEITMPLRGQFRSPDAFYATALHEVSHSTGHPSRLNRDLAHPFGSMGYAKEELRAEIASLMLGEELGIGHDPGQHAAYVANWIKALQEDPREIFRAAADAEKILKFMLEREREHALAKEQGVAIEPPPPEAWAQKLALRFGLDNEQAIEAREIAVQAQRADWYHVYSDDADVRMRGGAECNAIAARASAFAARSPLHAEIMSEVADHSHEQGSGLHRADWYLPAEDRNQAHAHAMGEEDPEREAGDFDRSPAQQRDTPMKKSTQRVNLHVPYADKDQAKAAGARWDKTAKVWYAPPGADLDKLAPWTKRQEVDAHSIASELRKALVAAELKLPADYVPVLDGKWHRFPVEGDKPGAKSGSYKAFSDGHPAGVIRNFLNPKFDQTWKSETPVQSLSAEQRVQMQKENQARHAARAADQMHEWRQVATQIKGLLDGCAPAPADHPYLAKKGAPAYGVLVNTIGTQQVPFFSDKPMEFSGKGELLVPVRDVDGQVWGAQSIRDDGRKSFPRGGRLAGLFHLIGDIENAKGHITAEGYATAATIHQATGLPVAVAFNANNLRAVAAALAERYPDQARYIAGDNDHRKEAQGKPNVGKLKAQEAAQDVGGVALIPQFGPGDKGTDWNDLGNYQGLDAVKRQLAAGLAIAERREIAAGIREEREKGREQGRVEERELVRGRDADSPPLPAHEVDRKREPALTR